MSEQQFITNDMIMSAVLIFFGEMMVDVKKNENQEVEFIFSQSLDLQDLVKAYSLGALNVEPRRFSVVLRDVKKIIFVQKGNLERGLGK